MKSAHVIGLAVAVLLAWNASSPATESTGATAPTNISDTVPLYTDLGSHHKRISTRVPAAQQIGRASCRERVLRLG